MKRAALVVFVLALLSAPVQAQDTPKAELFGGYSFFRLNSNTNLGGGWHGSIAGNVNKWFGVVGEFSGHHGESSTGINRSLHTITFGPRFSLRKHERVTPFAHFTYGFARTAGVWAHYGAVTAGAGLDMKATERVSIRIGQFDYVVTGFGIAAQHFRYSGGLVFRFASK